MREEFERIRCKSRLLRVGDDYSDPEMDNEWKIWKTAWTAAMGVRSTVPPREPGEIVTAEEMECIKKLYDQTTTSQAKTTSHRAK